MKVLVTGANGFLGSWLTKRLLAEGHVVSALVRKNSDLSELAGTAPKYFYGDITALDSLNDSFRDQEVIFHLAGVVAYKKSERALMDHVNVEGTANVIEACFRQNVSQLLHLSSVVAIGAESKPKVMTEQSEYNIHHLNLGYFETKKNAEDLVIKATRDKKIKAICVNPSTIYGAGDAKKGSRKTQVKVAKGKFPFYTSGGVNVVAVEDVVEGILLALKNGKNGERYILSAENMHIQDLFAKIAACGNVNPPPFQIPNYALHSLGILGDALNFVGIKAGISRENAYTASMFHWFDCAKAKNDLGFKPRSSDSAIENSVRWMKDNKYI